MEKKLKFQWPCARESRNKTWLKHIINEAIVLNPKMIKTIEINQAAHLTWIKDSDGFLSRDFANIAIL